MKIFTILMDILGIILSMTTGKKIKLTKTPPVPKVPVPDGTRVEDLEPTPESAFKLSAKSKRELMGVHPNLVEVVKRAIQITDMDFVVFDGKRSAKEQNRHYKNGASQLDGYKKKSYHQSGNAVDLVPFVKGREEHADWNNYYHVAAAMVKAANELGVADRIRWGAVWDRRLNKLPTKAHDLKRAVAAYTRRHAGKDFIDGPHFEWRD